MPKYYRFGGEPQEFAANWDGFPMAGSRSNTRRALGVFSAKKAPPTSLSGCCLGPTSSLGNFVDVTVDATVRGQLRRDLGDVPTFPTALTQGGAASLLSTGPERSNLNDAPATMGGLLDGFSENEKRLALVGAAAAAAFVGWKVWKKGRRK